MWTLHVDSFSNIKGIGLELVLTSPKGDILEQTISCKFNATNNKEEYKAMITGLSLAKEMVIKQIVVQIDLYLVAHQMQGSQIRDSKMMTYLTKVKEVQFAFEEFIVYQVPK